MAALRGFASDNNATIHPEILAAIGQANVGHAVGYGNDKYTEKAIGTLKRHLGRDASIFFVFNGTGANVLGLKAVTEPHNAIICAEGSHLYVDECGAPERFTGCKLLPTPTEDGKLTVRAISRHMHGFGDPHHVQPKVISLAQATEVGTVYTVAEVKEIAKFAHKHGLLLHMDGARIANAAARLGVGLKALTADAGVDVLSLGGTKNGMMLGEAVVLFGKSGKKDLGHTRKQGMQLCSKMRYVACQFDALFSGDLWLRNARHANAMAQLLVREVSTIPGVRITRKVEANAVFAIIPARAIPLLQKEYFFYTWDEDISEVRWMTSFDTTETDIKQFSRTLKTILKVKP